MRCYKRIKLSWGGGVEVLQKNYSKLGEGCYKRIILCFRWEEASIVAPPSLCNNVWGGGGGGGC